jgi:hypothetical protein
VATDADLKATCKEVATEVDNTPNPDDKLKSYAAACGKYLVASDKADSDQAALAWAIDWQSRRQNISDGQLLFCRVIDGAYQAGIDFLPNPQQYRRSELRVPLKNQSAIVFQLEGSRDQKLNAQATDISRSGLGLLVDNRLAVNTIVKVELSFAIVFGEVLYSKPTAGGGYRVGLRMETLLMRDGRMGLDAEILDRPLPCE